MKRIMNMSRIRVAVAAIAAGAALGASAFTYEDREGRRLTVVEPDETFSVGGAGADPYNSQGNVIVLHAGSTLVVTQTAALTVWACVVSTNGPATLQFVSKGVNGSFSSHLVVRDAGSLTVTGATSVNAGHSECLPYYDIPNLTFADTSGTGLGFSGCTIRRLPDNAPYYFKDAANVRLIGKGDVSPASDGLAVSRFNLTLGTPESIPPTKTVSASGTGKILVDPLDFVETGDLLADFPQKIPFPHPEGLVFSNTVELAAGTSLTMADASKAIGWAGTVTGSGTVRLGPKATVAASDAFADGGVEVRVASGETVKAAETLATVAIGTLSGTDLTSVLQAASNQTITVANPVGALKLTGKGEDANSKIVLSTLPAGTVVCDNGTATVEYAGSSEPPSDSMGIVSGDGKHHAVVFAGTAVDMGVLKAGLRGFPSFSAVDFHGTSSCASVPASMPLRGTEGSQTTVLTDGGAVTLAGAGEFTFEAQNDWQNRAMLWFDFSQTNLISRVGEATGVSGYSDKSMGSRLYIEQVRNVLDSASPYSLFNRRLVSTGTMEYVDSVYGTWGATAGTLNSLAYVDFGPFTGYSNLRRLPLAYGDREMTKGTGDNDVAPRAKQVVMVFGSAHGGGAALLSTTDGALARSGTSVADGITTNPEAKVWVDGVSVSPTAPNTLNEGWQVITIALDELRFNGIGWAQKNAGTLGGQQYGEIVVFPEELPEAERLEVELHLAEKWGLGGQYSSAARARLRELRTLRVTGAGTPTFNAGDRDVELGGAFAGRVVMGGGALKVRDGALPWTEADIPSEGRVFWMDPDCDSSVYTRGKLGVVDPVEGAEIIAFHDRALGSHVAGQPFVGGPVSRAPRIERAARGFGPERAWVDYNQPYFEADSGNNLRFYDYKNGVKITSNGVSGADTSVLSVRTAFYVQDSCRGGGSAATDQVGGGGSHLPARNNSYSSPVWPSSATAEVREGVNRLNGADRAVADGWSGLPEVFSFRTKTAGVNARFLASYSDTEKKTPSEWLGRIQGESLWYSTSLDDATILGIESYLMNKWLGRLPEGYVDVRATTVAGSGSVSAATAAQLPKIDAGFTGTVKAGTGAFEMTIDPVTGVVEGAIVAPGVTLDIPATRSIRVSFASKPSHFREKLVFKLVDVVGFATEGDWDLSFVGGNIPAGAVFVREGNCISVEVPPRGMLLMVR